MKSIDKEYLDEIVIKSLFENSAQINLPVDDGMYANNTRGSHFDRPYAQKDHLPLAANNLNTNKSAIVTTSVNVTDSDFVPDNEKELIAALSKLIDDAGLNSIPKEDLKKMWNIFKKYFSNK